MALNNCTINSSSVVVTPSQALGSGVANQVLTIKPNQGFRVAAADFTNNTGTLPSSINSITLSDSGVAYADGNFVLVTVDLKDTFNPGTSDHVVTIDIDGNATRIKDIPKTISGNYSVTVSNVTAVASGSYSASGNTGQQKDLFQITVSATNGNYFFDINDISVDVTTGDVSDYVIVKTPNGTGTSFTSCTINVDAIIPSENKTGNVISITANAISIPTPVNDITAYSMELSDMPYTFTKRHITVYGTSGAKFKLQVKNTGADNTSGTSDDYCYNFTTKLFQSSTVDSGELTIDSSGQHTTMFEFPVILADDTYTFTISAVSPTTLNLTNQTSSFTINRRGFKKVQVAATTARSLTATTITYSDLNGNTITHTGNNAINGQAGQINDTDLQGTFNFNIRLEDNEQFGFSTTNSATLALNSSHFTQTGNASIVEGTTSATVNNSGTTKRIDISGTAWYNNEFGTSDTTITFPIDNYTEIPGSGLPGGGNSNVLTIGATQYADISDGNASLIFPSGVVQGVTGRTSGSTTVTYTLAGIQISYPDLPSFVDSLGDVTITAGAVTGTQTTAKFNNATYSTNITSFNVSNAGTANSVATYDVTVAVTNFSPAVASGDKLRIRVDFNFQNDFS
tara:strand:- start:9736 stop:11616 length:1881 start_codon:yes stop_codon:yes gene_type:complete